MYGFVSFFNVIETLYTICNRFNAYHVFVFEFMNENQFIHDCFGTKAFWRHLPNDVYWTLWKWGISTIYVGFITAFKLSLTCAIILWLTLRNYELKWSLCIVEIVVRANFVWTINTINYATKTTLMNFDELTYYIDVKSVIKYLYHYVLGWIRGSNYKSVKFLFFSVYFIYEGINRSIIT